MAKFKPIRPKKEKAPPVQGGVPCLILLIAGIVAVCILMFLVLKYAGG